MKKPNWTEAKRYLALLAGEDDPLTCIQVFDDSPDKREDLGGHKHGRLSDVAIQKWLIPKIRQGAGIYYVVNLTDGKGRQKANMISTRAAIVDLDGAKLPSTFPIEPHVIIETSAGRWHLVWLLEPSSDFAAWSDLQRRLATYYGGDLTIVDPPRVMRMPGFDHLKGAPYRSHVIRWPDAFEDTRLSMAALAAAHPCDYQRHQAPQEPREAPAEVEWDTEANIERARAHLAGLVAETGDRNNQAYAAAAKLDDLAISRDMSLELLHEWNDDQADPLPEHEIERVVKHASTYKQNGAGVDAVPASDYDSPDAAEEPSDLCAADLAKRPRKSQEWIIRDMVPADEAILNNGDGGAGKTTTMLQLGVSVATGKPWLGRTVEIDPAPVIFFSCEESTDKLLGMLAPIVESDNSPYKITWENLRPNLRVIGLKDRATELITVNPKTGSVNATKLYEYFTSKIREHKPRLVIIDALYDVYAANINDGVQVRKFMRMIRKLCSVAPPCAVIVLGHPSMSGMQSGSGTAGAMAWRNAARGFLYTTRTPSKAEGMPAVHKIAATKQNYGKPDAEIEFTWQELFLPVLDDDKAAAAIKCDALVLELIAEKNKAGEGVNLEPHGNFAPRVLAKHPKAQRYSKDNIQESCHRLKASGVLVLKQYRKLDRKYGARLEIVTAKQEFAEVDAAE